MKNTMTQRIDAIKNDVMNQSSMTKAIEQNVFMVMFKGTDEDKERLNNLFPKDSPYNQTLRSRKSEVNKIIKNGGYDKTSLNEIATAIENNQDLPSFSVKAKGIKAKEKTSEDKAKAESRQANKYVKDVTQFAIDNKLPFAENIEKPADMVKHLNSSVPFIKENANNAFLEWELEYAKAQTNAQIQSIVDSGDKIDVESVKITIDALYMTDEQGFLDIVNHITSLMTGTEAEQKQVA